MGLPLGLRAILQQLRHLRSERLHILLGTRLARLKLQRFSQRRFVSQHDCISLPAEVVPLRSQNRELPRQLLRSAFRRGNLLSGLPRLCKEGAEATLCQAVREDSLQ